MLTVNNSYLSVSHHAIWTSRVQVFCIEVQQYIILHKQNNGQFTPTT